MIGLVLGDTNLGKLIINKLSLLKIKFITIDISKKKIFKKNRNTYPLSVGQLGRCIEILKNNNCKKVIFAGRVERPNFSKIKFDFKAMINLPKIIRETKKGDAYIINFISKLFEKEGIKVISQTFYNPEIVLSKGTKTKVKPNQQNFLDIKIGKKIIYNLNQKEVSQGALVLDGKIMTVENFKGTDFMLQKAKKNFKKLVNKKFRRGILIKLPKPNQDLRIDLPTIGIKTINKCVSLGLKGIVLKSKQNIFLERKKSINILNKNKMFLTII